MVISSVRMRFGIVTACLALALCALCIQPLPTAAAPRGAGANKEKKLSPAEAAAKALLDKSTALTNIEAPSSPAFLLEADVHLETGKEAADGKLGLSWAAHDLYKEMINFPGFSQTVVVRGEKLYRQRSMDFLPLPAYEWSRMLSMPLRWTLPDDATTEKKDIPNQWKGLPHITCLLAKIEQATNSVRLRVCLNSVNLEPLSFDVRSPEGRNIMYTFSDYLPVGDRRFPSRITLEDSLGLRAAVTVHTLTPANAFATNEFTPPAGSTEETWCEDPSFSPSKSANQFSRAGGFGDIGFLRKSIFFTYVHVSSSGKPTKIVVLYPAADAVANKQIPFFYHATLPIESCHGIAQGYETVLMLGTTWEMLP